MNMYNEKEMSYCSQCNRDLSMISHRIFDDVLCLTCVMQNQQLSRVIVRTNVLQQTYVSLLPQDIRNDLKTYIDCL